MKILLADDDETLRDSFIRQLVRLGHEVLPFANGRDLCVAIRDGAKADLVWTDLEMPLADGFEVMQVAHTLLPRVPILIVSGHTDTDHLMRALHAGATMFLPKPFDPSELHSVLRRADSLRMAHTDEERAWESLKGCTLMLRVPPDLGVAAAVATLVRNHARACLGQSERHGLHIAAHEILLNAIEHGCLEITREEKLEALGRQAYHELLAERQADPRLASRMVGVFFTASMEAGAELTITDPGPGFDPASLPDPSDIENLFLPSGRGIVLAKLHVDELSFADSGRTARVVVRRH